MNDLSDSFSVDPDDVPVALVQLSEDRKVESLNSAAETLFGISRRSAFGRSMQSLTRVESGIDALIDRSAEVGGRVSDPTFQLYGPTISGSPAQHACVCVTGTGKTILAFLPNAETGEGAKHLEALSNFGSILGHEVKNPLAGLSGAAQLLLRDARDEQKELLQLILSESGRITRLVDELSAFELFSKPRRVACNIHIILDDVLRSETLAFETVVFDRSFDPSLPDIYADTGHLHELFQNLIRNACEALMGARAPKSRNITISTRFSLTRRSTASDAGGGGRFIEVNISDNGPGIPADMQKQIFQMFHTDKASGSGLGLTIANQIVLAHDGQIEVDSVPGCTTFSVYLPIASERI